MRQKNRLSPIFAVCLAIWGATGCTSILGGIDLLTATNATQQIDPKTPSDAIEPNERSSGDRLGKAASGGEMAAKINFSNSQDSIVVSQNSASFAASTQIDEPPQALCYLFNLEVGSESRPLGGIRLEIVCAHASRQTIGVSREDSELFLLDGDRDLIAAGSQWVENYKQENPTAIFFSTNVLNGIEFKVPNKRVLPIGLHSSVLPKEAIVHLKGSVVLYVASPETIVLETTVGALRGEEPINLPGNNTSPVVPVNAGFYNGSPAIKLIGGATLADLDSGPEGVRYDNAFGEKTLVLEQNVPGDAPVRLKVRVGKRLKLPVDIEIPIG